MQWAPQGNRRREAEEEKTECAAAESPSHAVGTPGEQKERRRGREDRVCERKRETLHSVGQNIIL
jgi:hypothetical protein